MMFDESDICSLEEMTDATEIISKVKAEYQYRAQQAYPQVYFHERAQSQYLQGAPSAVLKTLEKLPIDARNDALYISQRTARMEGERQKYYEGGFSARAWPLLPGDFIRVFYERHGINAVLEILEVKKKLGARVSISLVLGNLHGLDGGFIFLSDDAPVFPNSLGGAACDAWDSGWS